jgi:hypothetical protein
MIQKMINDDSVPDEEETTGENKKTLVAPEKDLISVYELTLQRAREINKKYSEETGIEKDKGA